MNYSSAYTVWFDAGHRYKVTVSWDREGFPATDLDEFERVRDHVDNLAKELRNRDLVKMLGPHHPSVYGVASFFMDRLKLLAPINKVEAHESDGPVAIIEGSAEF